VSFAGLAADLVGSAPGEHVLFVVVAASGDLPAAVEVRAGEDPAALLAVGQRRQVLPQRITVLSEAPTSSDGRH
jgi:hypothetical protein